MTDIIDVQKKAFDMFSGRYIPEIDAFINDYYTAKIESAHMPYMRDMYGHLLEYCTRRGKRIRPLLMILSFLGHSDEAGPVDEIIKLSAVLEMMHSFLLIQDDIIDRSAFRRGEKSLHILLEENYTALCENSKLGTDLAIVLADVIFSNCLEIISSVSIDEYTRNEFMKIFSSTYELTAMGQILDSLHSMEPDIRPGDETHLHISEMKTAYYTIYYPLLMGYVLAGLQDDNAMKRIRDFALPLGMAFQLRDDVLGIFGMEKKTGKPSDSDMHEAKKTMLILKTIENIDDVKQFNALYLKKNKSPDDIRRIRASIRESGALHYAETELQRNIDLAKDMVNTMGLSEDIMKVLSGLVESLRLLDINRNGL